MSVERGVSYRERAAGCYSTLPFALALARPAAAPPACASRRSLHCVPLLPCFWPARWRPGACRRRAALRVRADLSFTLCACAGGHRAALRVRADLHLQRMPPFYTQARCCHVCAPCISLLTLVSICLYASLTTEPIAGWRAAQVLTYSMIQFVWTPAKFFLYFTFMYETLLYFTYFGMASVRRTVS